MSTLKERLKGLERLLKKTCFLLSFKRQEKLGFLPRDDVGFVMVPWELFCVIVSRFLSSSQ